MFLIPELKIKFGKYTTINTKGYIFSAINELISERIRFEHMYLPRLEKQLIILQLIFFTVS